MCSVPSPVREKRAGSCVRQGGRPARLLLARRRRSDLVLSPAPQGDVNMRNDAPGNLGRACEQGGEGCGGKAAECAAAAIGELLRRRLLLRTGIRQMSGTDNVIGRKDRGRHAAMGNAIRKALQQKKQQGQHCDSVSRTAILHDPANKLHGKCSGTVSPRCHCDKGGRGIRVSGLVRTG